LNDALHEINKKTETVSSKLEKYDYSKRGQNLKIIEEIVNDEEEAKSRGGR